MSAADSNPVSEKDESPLSDISPLTMPDGGPSKVQYFSPLTSPRLLDSIPEHHEHHDQLNRPDQLNEAPQPPQQLEMEGKGKGKDKEPEDGTNGEQRTGERSERKQRPSAVSRISFEEPTVPKRSKGGVARGEGEKKLGIGKSRSRRERIRGSSPPAPG